MMVDKIRGYAKIAIDMKLIKNVLHMPDNCEVVDVKYRGDVIRNEIILIVEADGLPPIEYGKEPVEIIPIISHQVEEYIWDWNLTSGE